ncbi:RnfABCDGE type electron transport complex subunit G [Agathobaculum sp.]|uniref:RnfABCDGE type electron transport complex subunit G n=1 Tax=Agathobaculum sp. TaxID=2048138 RepID=UPI002A8256B7|nr:RnfABCDGE type electron transport complex subunit G [Agathobaculum sp.]MDY3619236.1 RnfABCDGE type electron transport complex subunit G [Agathobaculum sp.]
MNDSKKGGGIAMLVVVLGLITLVCALLLGVVNQVTDPLIKQNAIDTRNAAMGEILPEATDFPEVEVPEEMKSPEDKNAVAITAAFKAEKDGEAIGYCVQVAPKGFGGALTLIVGINADGTVAGAKVTAHAETPGLGAKSQDAEWIAQYAGQPADGSLAVSKDGGTINAITGATITSRAVTNGVNAAAQFAATLG